MKKLLFSLIVCLLFAGTIMGQQLELSPYAGFEWGGKLRYSNGEVRFNSSENYGIAMNLLIPGGRSLQLEYFHQPTNIDVRYYDFTGPDFRRYDVNLNWFQAGAMQQIDLGGPVQPFGGITLGAAYFSPRTNEIQDVWKFAMTGQVGLKYYLSDKVGIRLHLRMLVPIQWAGFGFYFGSGGSGTTVNAGSYLIQGDVGGGLIFRLGPSSSSSKPVPSGM